MKRLLQHIQLGAVAVTMAAALTVTPAIAAPFDAPGCTCAQVNQAFEDFAAGCALECAAIWDCYLDGSGYPHAGDSECYDPPESGCAVFFYSQDGPC